MLSVHCLWICCPSVQKPLNGILYHFVLQLVIIFSIRYFTAIEQVNYLTKYLAPGMNACSYPDAQNSLLTTRAKHSKKPVCLETQGPVCAFWGLKQSLSNSQVFHPHHALKQFSTQASGSESSLCVTVCHGRASFAESPHGCYHLC